MISLLMLAALAAAAEPPRQVRTVPAVNLDRYVGTWYELWRFPSWFERQCAGDTRAIYAKRSDGRIDVTNQCRKSDGTTTTASGVARIVDAHTNAKLKVRFAPSVLGFLPFVWGDYWIIGLADDYSWAVVGTPDHGYLWILSRTPTLDQQTLDRAKQIASDNGFDVGRLIATPQTH